jgi:MFS family permease
MLAVAVPDVVVSRSLTDAELQRLLVPRDDLVLERVASAPPGVAGPATVHRFALAEGPFSAWERTVEIERATAGGEAEVVERVRFRLALPVWRFLFNPLVVRQLKRGDRGTDPWRSPWWSPPDRLEARTANALALLCVLSLFAGYLGTLLTQTNTFFKEEFGVDDGAIGWTLAVVRFGALLALLVVALADRRGRRTVLMAATALGCAFTATGALAPDLVWLAGSQTLARSFSTAMALIVSIIAVEETPAGSRAFAVSVLTMAGALGAGVCVMLLWVAELGTPAWRVLFLVPLLALLAVRPIARSLPESRRFVARAARPAAEVDAPARRRPPSKINRGRLLLLAASALCFSLFVSPASGFLNEYLRTERDFTAVHIIAFQILTNTPGGIGIIIGGKLADARGRRLVGATGLATGVGFTVLMYLGTGWEIWLWSLLGAVLGAMAVPALGVYGPELFPTGSRGRANGVINLFAVVGSAAGLAAAGLLADRLAGGLPHAITILAAGPVLVVLLVLFLYPETAARELEELNPEDAPLSREMLALEGLEPDTTVERYPPRPGIDPSDE